MLEGFLLSAAFAAGQSPVPAVPVPVVPPTQFRVQAAQPAQPAPMPMPPKTTTPPAAMPMPTTPVVPVAPATPAPVYYEPAPAAVAAEEPAPEAPTYFLQNLFGETPMGAWLKDKGISYYGWTEFSYNGSTTSRSNAPIFMQNQANKWVMNQNFLHLDKAIDTSRKEFQLGGTAEMILPGTDYLTTLSRNLLTTQLNNSPNGLPNEYGIDLFQAYGEMFLPGLGANGTTLKVGKFATFLEYELVQGALTPFVNRSFLFQYNPFTHTGVLATTQLNDDWTMGNGLVLGNDNFVGQTARPTYIGFLKYAPKDGDVVQFGTSITDPSFSASQGYNYYNVYNLQWTHALNDCLTYQLDASYSHMNSAPGIGFTDWYGAVQYLFWKHSDTVTSNFRFELFEDSDGYRTGTSGLYTSVTYGPTWTPCDWLMLRPSVQYVHNSNGPFEGDSKVWIGSFDCVIRW